MSSSRHYHGMCKIMKFIKNYLLTSFKNVQVILETEIIDRYFVFIFIQNL